MLTYPTLRAPWEPHHSTESLSRPNCPRCGSALLVAEESRFSPAGRIDHDWLCDDCGNAFVTSITLARTLVRA
jgi:transposase-like protein